VIIPHDFFDDDGKILPDIRLVGEEELIQKFRAIGLDTVKYMITLMESEAQELIRSLEGIKFKWYVI